MSPQPWAPQKLHGTQSDLHLLCLLNLLTGQSVLNHEVDANGLNVHHGVFHKDLQASYESSIPAVLGL